MSETQNPTMAFRRLEYRWKLKNAAFRRCERRLQIETAVSTMRGAPRADVQDAPLRGLEAREQRVGQCHGRVEVERHRLHLAEPGVTGGGSAERSVSWVEWCSKPLEIACILN